MIVTVVQGFWLALAIVVLTILVVYTWLAERSYARDFMRQFSRLHGRSLLELTRLGLPAGAMQLLESGFFIALSLGEALAVRMAYHKSAANPHMVRQLAWFGDAVSSAITLCFVLLLLIRPEWVVSLFMNPQAEGYAQTLEYAVILAGIAALFLLFDGYQVLSTWMLRGLKDTVVPVIIGLGGYWLVGIGLGALFSFGFGRGPRALWWGFAIGLSTAGLVLVLRVIHKARVPDNSH